MLFMNKILIAISFAALAAAPASAGAPFEGRWANPKKTVIINVAPCGPAHCGTVVWASQKARDNARKGGTANLIGTRLITGIRPAGNGVYKGRAFIPKQNVHASATIRQAGPNVMIVKGCALAVICKEQRWTRVK